MKFSSPTVFAMLVGCASMPNTDAGNDVQLAMPTDTQGVDASVATDGADPPFFIGRWTTRSGAARFGGGDGGAETMGSIVWTAEFFSYGRLEQSAETVING
jgi:hypothetical protein